MPGWFGLDDALTFVLIDEVQRRSGIAGDLLEIGVYKGQSAILLGLLAGDGEQVIVCDLFETDPGDWSPDIEQDLSWYDSLNLDSFLTNWLRFLPEEPNIVVGPSQALHEQEWTRPLRLIHIDGGHTYQAVRSDLDLALKLSHKGQIVVLDDIRHGHTPGVPAAAWESVANDGLIPFAMSEKLYATVDADLAEMMVERLLASELMTAEHCVKGRRLVEIRSRNTARNKFGRWIPPALEPVARQWSDRARRWIHRTRLLGGSALQGRRHRWQQ